MKKIFTVASLAVLVLFAQKAKAQSEDEMKKWTDYMTPGKMHKLMNGWDGSWTGSITMWMAPGAPPSQSKGTLLNKTIMDGRYQMGTHTGDFNGMPFEGISILAYDNAKKIFESTRIDNMGTGIMHLKGDWNDKKQVLTLSGTMTDPMTGQDTKVKETFTILDDNTHTMEMFMVGPDGKEFRTMEIVYKRNN